MYAKNTDSIYMSLNGVREALREKDAHKALSGLIDSAKVLCARRLNEGLIESDL